MQKANKNEVRKEIADLINRIKEQSDRIGTKREIPQTELDLILHRIEELHRKTVVWSFLNELPDGAQFSVLGSQLQKESGTPAAFVPDEIKPETPSVVPPVNVEKVVEQPNVTEQLMPSETVNSAPDISEHPVPSTVNLKDVRNFIGFNEKLMYIRQVFGGDNAAYEAALEQFNSMNTWTEAETFLSVLATEYKWGKENEPVAIFIHTVKRRFS